MRDMISRAVRCGLAVTAATVVAGCHDLLQVQNPQAFTNTDANKPSLLPAVAAGAEGDFQLSLSSLVIQTGMLSDEFWHTGTWSDWLDVSTGAIRANWPLNGAFTFPEDQLLRARAAAAGAASRFEGVLGDTAHTSPLFVTAEISRAWSDLMLAMSVCQAPAGPGLAMISDTAMFKQAADSLSALLLVIQNAHFTKASDRQARLDFANAGLARASLMLGNYTAAATYAQAVSPGFEYDAQYSSNSGPQNNQMANQGNANYNRSFTIRGIWYPLIDTIAGFLKDPYSGQSDPRIPLGHDNNNARGYDRGSNGVTKFFSLNKYPSYASPIPVTKSAEMYLIIAEVRWRQGDFQGAISEMNINRSAVGLPPFVVPTTGDISTGVRDLLLQERFAALFGEGDRMQDLYRFGLVTQRLGPGRAIKLPLSRNEELTNPKIGEGRETCPGVS